MHRYNNLNQIMKKTMTKRFQLYLSFESMFCISDRRVCQYPSQIKYTISYENVVCTSGATKIAVHSFMLIIVLALFNLQ